MKPERLGWFVGLIVALFILWVGYMTVTTLGTLPERQPTLTQERVQK